MDGFGALGRLVTGRRGAWMVIVLALLVSGVIIARGGEARSDTSATAGLPDSAQSTTVARLQDQLPSGRTTQAIVVLVRDGGLTDTDLDWLDARRPALVRDAVDGRLSPVQRSDDGTVALVAVPFADAGQDAVTSDTERLRSALTVDRPDGLTVQVTGPAGFTTDVVNAFDGADVTLLLATVGVVALLLFLTYRSPLLPLVPLAVVGAADQVANALLSMLSRHTGFSFDAATSGITEVLVFGAGTDYGLLLIARYREELRRVPDRRDAMRRALRAAGPAIAASSVTVVLALLTLLAASFGSNRSLGVAGAVGLLVALVAGLVVLPAALVVCPRGVFWPLVPRADEAGAAANATEGRTWRRLGTATARRPWRVVVGSTVVLAALGAGLATTSFGLSQADSFRGSAESVDGLTTLSRAFPAGTVDPVTITTVPSAVTAVVAAAQDVPGVVSARAGESGSGIATVEVVLRAAPDTPASFAAVRALRDAVADVPGARAAVGGTVATDLDTRDAATHDLRLIAPLVLLVVLVMLLVLLRAVVASVLLVLTVVASFFAALGAASWLFDSVLDFPGLDVQVPLLGFLFLVALGVDYNVFLVTRAKEEAARAGTRRGIVDALAVTGGVITSAGVLLAAVFAVLGVLPVTVLTQLGVVVGVGVLLDTLLVRTVLVPALVHLLGERWWWPARPADHADPAPDAELAPAGR